MLSDTVTCKLMNQFGRFWNRLQFARRITLNRLDVVEPLSFKRNYINN